MKNKTFLEHLADRNKKERLEKDLMSREFKKLSISEKNDYEQIIERHNSNLLWMPYSIIKSIGLAGLFFIIISYITGIDIEIFRDLFILLTLGFGKLIIPILIAIVVYQIINQSRISKIKKSLLLKK